MLVPIMVPMHGLHLIADLRGCPADRPEMTEIDALKDACLAAVGAAGLHPVGTLFHPFTAAPEIDETADFGTNFKRSAGSVVVSVTGLTTSQGARTSAHGPGITGVVLLAESHLAIHTWPELGAVTLDTYVCNVGTDNSTRAHALMAVLIALFSPKHIEQQVVERGRLSALRS